MTPHSPGIWWGRKSIPFRAAGLLDTARGLFVTVMPPPAPPPLPSMRLKSRGGRDHCRVGIAPDGFPFLPLTPTPFLSPSLSLSFCHYLTRSQIGGGANGAEIRTFMRSDQVPLHFCSSARDFNGLLGCDAAFSRREEGGEGRGGLFFKVFVVATPWHRQEWSDWGGLVTIWRSHALSHGALAASV